MHDGRHPLLFTMLDELVLRERMPRPPDSNPTKTEQETEADK